MKLTMGSVKKDFFFQYEKKCFHDLYPILKKRLEKHTH